MITLPVWFQIGLQNADNTIDTIYQGNNQVIAQKAVDEMVNKITNEANQTGRSDDGYIGDVFRRRVAELRNGYRSRGYDSNTANIYQRAVDIFERNIGDAHANAINNGQIPPMPALYNPMYNNWTPMNYQQPQFQIPAPPSIVTDPSISAVVTGPLQAPTAPPATTTPAPTPPIATPTTSSTASGTADTSGKKSGFPTWGYVAIIGGVVIVVGGIGAFVMMKKKG